MRKIYINGRCLERDLTGVERYTLSILSEFDTILDEEKYNKYEVILLVSSALRYSLHYKNISIVQKGRFTGVVWEQFELPYFSRDGYLLSLHSIAPLLKVHQMLVMHDAKMARKNDIDLSEFSRLFYYGLNVLLGKTMSKIITISNFAKHDLIEGFGISPDKITVILNGVDTDVFKIKAQETENRWNLSKGKFVLGVGGGTTKNNTLTAQAVEKIGRDDIFFVLAGNVAPVVKERLNSMPHTIMLGKVSDTELIWLYQNALCLGFPSLVEGFGLPPVEAMASGIPVIASRCQAIPEVCGEAAIYIDADNTEEMKNAIEALISDEDFRMTLVNKGYENIKRFNWHITATKILNLVCDEIESIHK